MRDIIVNVGSDLLAAIIIGGLAFIRHQYVLRLSRAHPKLPTIMLLLTAAVWLAFNVSVAYITHSPVWIIAMLLASSSGIAWLFWKEISQFYAVGIRGADRQIRRGIDYAEALDLCRNYFMFLGIGASKLTREPSLEDTLLRCRPDVPIRFLLLSPNNRSLQAAARRAGKNEAEYHNLVTSSLRKIAELKRARDLNIEVRFYDERPIFRLMFIDRRFCLVSYNHVGEGDGSQLPQLHVVKTSHYEREVNSFYYAFELYFDALWERSKAWDFKSFL